MKQFQKILCVVNSSAQCQVALHRAVELAEHNGARLTLVEVLRDTPRWLQVMLARHTEDIEHVRDGLETLAAEVRAQVPSVNTKLLHGHPALAVVREVLNQEFDLVMKDARGIDNGKRSLGPTDMRLLRNCPCPVWLDVPDHGRSHDVILAAIDPLDEDKEHRTLNQTILELAVSLGVLEEAEVHVISAWGGGEEYLLAGRVPSERFLEYLAENQRAAEEGLRRALGHVRPRVDHRCAHLRKGDPAEVILKCASEIQSDMIVMGSVARGVPGLLIGNTADAVLRRVDCSVMTVKPEGFISPLQMNRSH